MNGRRLPDGFNCTTDALAALGESTTPHGSYWKETEGISAGTWSIVTPNGRHGSIAKHTVVEHEDGTITVSPSILVYTVEGRVYSAEERARMVELTGEEYVQRWERGRPGWHGFLERGVWREC